MKIKLLIFASLKDSLREKSTHSIEVPKTDWLESDLKDYCIEYLRTRWIARHKCVMGVEQEANLKTRCILLAINEKYLNQSETVTLVEGDHIALIPPVCGG